MCLSTAYLNHKDEDKVAARYVANIEVNGSKISILEDRIRNRDFLLYRHTIRQ